MSDGTLVSTFATVLCIALKIETLFVAALFAIAGIATGPTVQSVAGQVYAFFGFFAPCCTFGAAISLLTGATVFAGVATGSTMGVVSLCVDAAGVGTTGVAVFAGTIVCFAASVVVFAVTDFWSEQLATFSCAGIFRVDFNDKLTLAFGASKTLVAGDCHQFTSFVEISSRFFFDEIQTQGLDLNFSVFGEFDEWAGTAFVVFQRSNSAFVTDGDSGEVVFVVGGLAIFPDGDEATLFFDCFP